MNQNNLKKNKFIPYLICYLAYASIYIARLNLSMASPALKDAGVLTTVQIGYLGTAFSVVYACGRLYNGFRADFEQPRKMIFTGLLVCGAANIGFGLFPPFIGILLLWCANSFAQSMLWSSVLKTVNHLYKDSDALTSRLSTMVSSVAAGNVLGILVSMYLISVGGPRWAFIIPGAITLVMAALVFMILPKDVFMGDAAQPEGSANPLPRMLQLLRDPEIRLAVAPALCHGVMKDNVTLWMTVFFVDAFAIDIGASAGFVLFIPVVGLIARLLYPTALKLAGNNEHKVSIASFTGAVIVSLLLIVWKQPIVAVICLSLVYAFASLTNSSLLSIFPARFEKKGFMASVSGVMDFGNYLGAAAGSFIYGHTIDRLGYNFMFLTWIVISLITLPFLLKLSRSK